MRSKLLKSLVYIFFGCIILFFVLTISPADLPWVDIAKYICIGVAALVVLFYVYLFIYCAIDNKNVEKLSDQDRYKELVSYINKRIKQKLYVAPERINFYNYYLLLSYLHLQNDEMIDIYFNKSIDEETFPVIIYWKASYELSKGKKENIFQYYESFKSSSIINKNLSRYQNILNTFESMVLYADNKIDEAKVTLKKVDESKISIPSTIKVINTIKESVNENEN